MRIVGGDEGSAPPDYARQLQRRINDAGLQDVVELVGALPYDQIVTEYHHASVHVNLCPTGGMDKAVLEGMACGVPTLVRNETFAALLGAMNYKLSIRTADPRGIADRIAALLTLPYAERMRLGGQLNRAVAESFGQAAFIKSLTDALHPTTT